MEWDEWACFGGRANLVFGGTVLALTAFEWIGRVDLSWVESKSCLGWGRSEI